MPIQNLVKLWEASVFPSCDLRHPGPDTEKKCGMFTFNCFDRPR